MLLPCMYEVDVETATLSRSVTLGGVDSSQAQHALTLFSATLHGLEVHTEYKPNHGTCRFPRRQAPATNVNRPSQSDDPRV